jgi:signal transduction histidine kinase
LRLGFYVVLLVEVARELRQYWESLASMAVADERRRMAEELHDGLIQDLAFVRSVTSRPTLLQTHPELVPSLQAAADRALHASRDAVASLHGAGRARLGPTLLRAAESAVAGTDTCVRLECEPGVTVPADALDDVAIAVGLLASDAAGRRATCVALHLRRRGTATLVEVTDDGDEPSTGASCATRSSHRVWDALVVQGASIEIADDVGGAVRILLPLGC